MIDLKLNLPKKDKGFIILAKPKEGGEDSEKITNEFIDFLKGNSPRLYNDVEREIVIRVLARSCDSYYLRRIKEDLDINIKSYPDGLKLYNALEEAIKRRSEQECTDI
jgi:hypothetical protein